MSSVQGVKNTEIYFDSCLYLILKRMEIKTLSTKDIYIHVKILSPEHRSGPSPTNTLQEQKKYSWTGDINMGQQDYSISHLQTDLINL